MIQLRKLLLAGCGLFVMTILINQPCRHKGSFLQVQQILFKDRSIKFPIVQSDFSDTSRKKITFMHSK